MGGGGKENEHYCFLRPPFLSHDYFENVTTFVSFALQVQDEEEDECESVSESDTGTNDGPLPLTDYCPAVSLVDQVIDVDNLVTKLLKVLRIIQLENDTCIQELKEDK